MHALLACEEVQRLRRVKQLGLASLVFPGAEHSRFSHALGTAHVMTRLLERIQACQHVMPAEQRLDGPSCMDGVAAALLHDLGHGPFSHLYEDVLSGAPSHEWWTQQILLNPSSDVHQALESFSTGMTDRVTALLGGKGVPILSQVVSGLLDVDRFDYLLRDSHMTGTPYGLFDLDWLLRSLCVDQRSDGQWVVAVEGRKGAPPIEGYFLGRHHMYRQVYHHKAIRAAEFLVRSIFKRLSDLANEGHVVPSCPEGLRAALEGRAVSIAAYLALDDPLLHTCFAQWRSHGDSILSALCTAMVVRQLPKTVPLPSGDTDREIDLREEAHRRAARVAKRAGYDPNYWVCVDWSSDTPYAETSQDTTVWVSLRHQPLTPLSKISFVLAQLNHKRVSHARLAFPSDIREAVEAQVGPLFR